MRPFTEWLRLNMRVCLAATLMIEAFLGLFPHIAGDRLPSVLVALSPTMNLQSSALIALYFVLGIWLMLGIRTATVAAMAAVLLIVPAIIATPDGDPALAIKVTLVAVFSLPLVLFGGGQYTTLETDEPWMASDEETDVIGRIARF